MSEFIKHFEIRWADLDPNRHLRHSAFADYATHLRFSYLRDHGFGQGRFQELGFGPVIFREEVRFRAEVEAGETIAIDFRALGLAPDASRWDLTHDVVRSDGKTAATVRVEGGWLDLVTRKLTVPPEEIRLLLERLPRTDDFSTLAGIGR